MRCSDWLAEILWDPIGDEMGADGVPLATWRLGENWLESNVYGDSDSDNNVIGCDVVSNGTSIAIAVS